MSDPDERQIRNDQIVAMKARGMTYEQIAAVVDMSRRQVQNIMQAWRDTQPKLRTQDPLDIIDEMLEGYQADLNELATVGQATKNDAVKVGAVNSRMAARDRIIALLQTTGVLPHDLGKLKVEIDIKYISTRLVAVLNKYDVPIEARRELLALLEGDEDETAAIAAAN